MHRLLLGFLACAIAGGAYFAYNYYTAYVSDDLDSFLAAMDYNPVHPPRDGFRLGSLYDIDSDGNPDILCAAPEEEVRDVIVSRSADHLIDGTKHGAFSLSGDIANQVKEKLGANYEKRISLTLSKVQITAIPGSVDGRIQDMLMNEQWCHDTVRRHLELGRYVCQAEASFTANAVYSIQDDDGSSLSNSLTPANSSKEVLKTAVQANTTVDVKDDGKNVTVGDALVYGAKLDPICVTPADALFVRTWPHSLLARALNYVKYNLIEPLAKKVF